MRVRGEGPPGSLSLLKPPLQPPPPPLQGPPAGGRSLEEQEETEKPCPSGAADMGPCLWALAGVWNGCPWHFCGHSGAPSRTLAALSPATASGIQGPPPSSSLGPLLLLAACQSKGTPRLAHVAPAHFAGRHTPFAELKAKREAADTRLETEETPAGMPSLQHSVSCLKLSDGPQEPPHPHPRPVHCI